MSFKYRGVYFAFNDRYIQASHFQSSTSSCRYVENRFTNVFGNRGSADPPLLNYDMWKMADSVWNLGTDFKIPSDYDFETLEIASFDLFIDSKEESPDDERN